MKDVLVLTTGGTIASQTTENGLAPGLADDALLTYFGEVPGVTLSSEAVMSKDSTNMQPEDWLDLARRVKAYEDEYDAFIITHGTDTMGYTAAALSYLLIDVKKPVILTGSQVPVKAQGTDAVRNLNDALTYASQTELHGVFVVFDGRVMLGTRTVKTKTKSYDAFESINYPYLAKVSSGKVRLAIIPPEEPLVGITPHLTLDTNIFVLKAFPGMPVEIFDYLAENVHALVIESFGNGGLPFQGRNLLPGIKKLVGRQIPVIITTQILEEGQEINLYEVGKQVADAGGITAGDMNTEAIVAKLMWILAETRDFETIKRLMHTPIAHDVDFV